MNFNILKSASLIAATIFIGVGCNKIAQPVAGQGSEESKDGNFTVTFVQEETKTAFNNDGSVWWANGDQVVFAQNATVGETVNTFKITYVTLPSDRKLLSATISSFNTPDSDTEAAYFSVYPYAAYTSRYNENGVVYPQLNLTATQTPSANGYDGTADILVSNYMESSAKETNLTMKYKRLGSFAKITLKNIASDVNIVSVQFSALKNGKDVRLAGKRAYDLKNGEYASFALKSDTKEYTITLDCSGFAASPASFDAYMCSYPFELGEGDSFTIKAISSDGYIFTKKVVLGAGQDLRLVSDHKTNFTVNMADALVECPWFYLTESLPNTLNKVYVEGGLLKGENITAVKYAIVTKAEFDAIANIDEYVTTYGTSMEYGDIYALNTGIPYDFTKEDCTIDTQYFVVVKVTIDDSDSFIQTYSTRTDWCKLAVVTRSQGGIQIQVTAKGVANTSKAYRIVPTSTLDEIADYESYYTNTLKPGQLASTTFDTLAAKDGVVCALGTTSYHTGSGSATTAMVSGVNYTILWMLTNSRGESKFLSASANAK